VPKPGPVLSRFDFATHDATAKCPRLITITLPVTRHRVILSTAARAGAHPSTHL